MASPVSDILGDIPQPDIPDIALPGVPELFSSKKQKTSLDNARKAWHEVTQQEPRCDFTPNRQQLKPKKPIFVHCLWRRSQKGPTLSEIKESTEFIGMFAAHTARFISQTIGSHLDKGDWVLITPPPRRHRQRNFAQSVADEMARELGMQFNPDVLKAKNRQRVMATFEVEEIPKQQNILVYDDIMTTGSTFQACHRALLPYNKNLIYFTSISNE